MSANRNFYEMVVRVTSEYLGPAADRFVSRQVCSHLHKDIEELRKQDLIGLIDWVGLAMGVLVEDEALVNQYVADLRSLTSRNGVK